MTTQYTPTLKLALPVTGELSGTWGDTVNDNITSMIEQAIAGLVTINTWTGNGHTLTTANGTTSESRCAMLVAATGGGAPTAVAEIICPAAAKLYVLQNNTAFAVTLKTSAGTGIAVAAGNTAFLFCDGTNVNACVTTIIDGRVTGNLTVDGNATINGNTTLGNATTDTITATARFNTDLVPSTDNARDLGSVANSWKDLYIDGTATMALVAISGGTINGVSIGATTAATLINVDNLRLDGNTISSTDTNGNVVIAPNGTGDVQLDADTVRVGDANATATVTSNGSGSLVVTTGGAGTTTVTTGGIGGLTLSTNSGTNSGVIQIAGGVDGDITLTPNGTGDIIMSADRTQFGDANTDTTLTTNGTGSLNLTTNNGSNSGTIQLAQGINGNITLTPNGTGSVSVPKLVWSNGTATRVPYLTTGGQFTDSANLTFNGTDLTVSGAVNAGTINATTLDLTNLEVTNIKAKDGTAGMQIADSTGVVSFTANPVMSGGTANGVAYLNGSKVLTTGSALTFDGTNIRLNDNQTNTIPALTQGIYLGSTTNDAVVGYSLRVQDGVNNRRGSMFLDDANGVWGWDVTASSGVPEYVWRQAGSEQMRLTSTGLGIGTSSPAVKLDVVGTVQSNGVFSVNGTTTGSASKVWFGSDGAGGAFINTPSSKGLAIYQNNATLLANFDSSGNLGLGVTPVSSFAGYKNFQIASQGLISSDSTSNGELEINNNAYRAPSSATLTYINSFAATKYAQYRGEHRFFNAPSGTAGNAISFTQAMTLDASGRLGIGQTSPAYKLDIRNDVPATTSLNPTTIYMYNNTDGGSGIEFLNAVAGKSKISFGVESTGSGTDDTYIGFSTCVNGGTLTERARIDSSGNLLVGTTSSLGTAGRGQFVQPGAGSAGAVISADATSGTFTYSVAWFAANRSASSAFNFINCTSDQYATPQFRVQGNGVILAQNTTVQSISDVRTKENIRDSEEGLQIILALQPRRFDFKQGFGNGRKNALGFVAQEIETVFPDAVSEVHLDPDSKDIAYKTVGPGELIPVLVKAIQEQQAIITALTARVAALESN